MSSKDRLEAIKKDLSQGTAVAPVTVREFLRWFGAQRRGSWVVWWIRSRLNDAGLLTDPDFQSAYIDSSIQFLLAPKPEGPKGDEVEAAVEVAAAQETTDAVLLADPTYRISKLAAANNTPIYVAPDTTKREAITLMLANDFSQLPVMTTERDVKGVISWTSVGSRLALERGGDYVRDLMDAYYEIEADASIFQAIPIIVQHQYVLIRGPDRKITGIVTATDLSLQFQQLTEPFLLLGEIENHIRLLLMNKFSDAELKAIRDPADNDREISIIPSFFEIKESSGANILSEKNRKRLFFKRV